MCEVPKYMAELVSYIIGGIGLNAGLGDVGELLDSDRDLWEIKEEVYVGLTETFEDLDSEENLWAETRTKC